MCPASGPWRHEPFQFSHVKIAQQIQVEHDPIYCVRLLSRQYAVVAQRYGISLKLMYRFVNRSRNCVRLLPRWFDHEISRRIPAIIYIPITKIRDIELISSELCIPNKKIVLQLKQSFLPSIHAAFKTSTPHQLSRQPNPRPSVPPRPRIRILSTKRSPCVLRVRLSPGPHLDSQ